MRQTVQKLLGTYKETAAKENQILLQDIRKKFCGGFPH
jgi:hypothetical protein